MQIDAFLHRTGDWRDSTARFCLQSLSLQTVPLRIRPVILCILAVWLLILGVVGILPNGGIPINDKVMHFFGMGIATFLIYFLLEVPDQARRVWYYRRAPLILTLFLGFFCGGVLSEAIQGYLPWKTFQLGDILANISGSCVAFYFAHALNKRARKRYEISRLYRPVNPASGPSAYEHLVSDDYEGGSPSRGRKRDLEGGRSGSFSETEDAWDDNASMTEGRYGRGGLRSGSTVQEVFALGGEDEGGEVER